MHIIPTRFHFQKSIGINLMVGFSRLRHSQWYDLRGTHWASSHVFSLCKEIKNSIMNLYLNTETTEYHFLKCSKEVKPDENIINTPPTGNAHLINEMMIASQLQICCRVVTYMLSLSERHTDESDRRQELLGMGRLIERGRTESMLIFWPRFLQDHSLFTAFG